MNYEARTCILLDMSTNERLLTRDGELEEKYER